MSHQTFHRECPHCGGVGESSTSVHMAHGGSHMVKHFGMGAHANPLALGAGLLIAAAGLAKSTVYKCNNCRRTFVKLT